MSEIQSKKKESDILIAEILDLHRQSIELACFGDGRVLSQAACSISTLAAENQKLTDCLRRLLIAVTMRMGADAPTPEDRLELSNAHQQAEKALAVQP